MRLAATTAVLLAAAPGAALAQAFDGTQGVDTFTGPLVSSSRILGLGGACVAVAEGLDGAEVNPAAVAQRNRHLARGWDWDWLLTWYVPDASQVGRQDLGNDGLRDAGLSGIGNGQLGLSVQYGAFGLAFFGGGWSLAAPRAGVGSVQLDYSSWSLAAGGSFRRETIVVGASITGVSGVARLSTPSAAPVEVDYSGSTVRVGALLRPRDRSWRLGAAFDFGARARPTSDRAAVPVATPAEFVFPWVASVGLARWVGPNEDRFNEPPPVELERHPEWGPGPEWQEARRRPVLLTAQLDVVGPEDRSVSIESALVPSAAAERSGAQASVVPRVGIEAEPMPEVLRLRAGSYIEPSRTGSSPRAHGTFGLDVRVPFPFQDLRLGFAGDLADRYQNVSLSLGFWTRLGPAPPTAAADL